MARNLYDSNGRVTSQYNYSTAAHGFSYALSSGKVSKVSYTNRSGNQIDFYFNTSNFLSTKRDVLYSSEGSSYTATTLITRGCACTLPTAIQAPDDEYTTFVVDSDGNVTSKRQYYDTTNHNTTAGQDIVRKAYFDALTSSNFAEVTKISGPMGFASGATESNYQITITYDSSGNPITITYPDTTEPDQTTQTGHIETRVYNSYGQLLTKNRQEGMRTIYTYYASGDSPSSNLGYLKQIKVKYSSSAELVTSMVYNDFGARTQVRDPNGNDTFYTTDNKFLVTTKTTASPFSYMTLYGYNANGQLVSKQLENRQGTGSRDTNNPFWETKIYHSDGGTVVTLKREVGQSGSEVTWQEVSYAYDNDYRRTLALDGRGKKTLYVLDERGLVVTTTKAYASPSSPDQSITRNVYDKSGHPSKTIRPFRNYDDSSDTNLITTVLAGLSTSTMVIQAPITMSDITITLQA